LSVILEIEMGGHFTCRQAACGQRLDDLVEVVQASLALLHDDRLKRADPIT
jgi:hypothetical protein